MSMNSERKFAAPWSISLKLITLLSAIVLLAIPAIMLINASDDMGQQFIVMVVLLPVAILVVSAFFMIRGYQIRNGVLYVQRLGWRSSIDLTDLVSSEADPQAMHRSIRLFGNGGLFCFAGKFRNKKLGSYRAYATDRAKAVVLRFPDRVVVVTPQDPAIFSEVVGQHL